MAMNRERIEKNSGIAGFFWLAPDHRFYENGAYRAHRPDHDPIRLGLG